MATLCSARDVGGGDQEGWAARMAECIEKKEAEGRTRMLDFSLSMFATEAILKAQNEELQQQLDAERQAAAELQRRLEGRMEVERSARDRIMERMQEELRRCQRQLVLEERGAREARRLHREAEDVGRVARVIALGVAANVPSRPWRPRTSR